MELLIAEDEEFLRMAMARDLAEQGYAVTETGNGSEALDLLRQRRFDIVLSDVRMPGLDGVRLLAAIRAEFEEPPVFMFVTGLTDLPLAEAYRQGADALFTKPFRRDALHMALKRASSLGHRRRRGTPRLVTDFGVEIETGNSERRLSGRMFDVGKGGMMVSTAEEPPQPGSGLAFRILFNEGEPPYLCGRGEVRWARSDLDIGPGYACGVRFVEFDRTPDESAQRLIETLQA